MVLQYKPKKGGNWRDYNGKGKLEKGVSNYWFRLLDEKKKKVLVRKGSYSKVMKRFLQIEYFKRK
jgi:hypothetical protein